MPEGDTVWLAARTLRRALAGQVLTGSDFRVPQLATSDLTGWRVDDVQSRGKHLLTRLVTGTGGDAGESRGAPAGVGTGPTPLTLHTHFRMEGSWHLYRRGERWGGGPGWQVRVVLRTPQWEAVGYRLPVVELFPTADEDRAVGHLGPDLLGDDWDAAEAARRLRADPTREIGPALLDQRNLAGIGNLYKTEVLFLRGLSPWTPVGAVADLAALVELARRLLDANKLTFAQVTTGDGRRGQEHWVFERAGRPCRRCRTRIERAEQGAAPYQRLSYWCPRCQPNGSPR
jgi:endonuclease VIII